MKRLLAIAAAASILALIPSVVSGAGDETFTGNLTGAAEVPPVAVSATGTVYVFINPAGTEVKYAISYTGLSGALVATHIHIGAPGTNGQIMLPIVPGPSTMFGTLTAADFQPTSSAPTWASALTAIRNGNAYVNLHTAAHPTGELRAQLKRAPVVPTPVATAAPTPSPKPSPAGTPTPRFSVSPLHTLPATATAPRVGRQNSTDLLPVLAILLLGALGGLVATAKVKPRRAMKED